MYIVKDEADFDQILKENKSVFIDFYADWCGPCKMVGPVVEGLAEENTDVKFIKVNVDDNPEVAERYGVMSIPMLVAVKDGKTAATTLGFQPRESIQNVINAAK
ncbi:MAG TPA: thioredoxin [Erysipelotrichaceae bacterium]|nr:thioredoxin [Erysipelotrichaceae bacterium]